MSPAPKKLNDKIEKGTYKNFDYAQAIESDPIYIQDLIENYGLILDEVAQAYFNFHFYRSRGLKNPMF
tara:strand:- start:303 stop:506 length:204 start_codon:yes stop_codon:yes gene_type:complete